MDLILASASPRRKELLAYLGYSFDIEVSNINEDILSNEKPYVYVKRVSEEKCNNVAQKNPEKTVLAADTSVVLGDLILGKPTDDADSNYILNLLSGKRHQVLTAVSIYSPKSETIKTEISETSVSFRLLSEKEINDYTLSGAGRDKAGAYGFQNSALCFISKIEGSPSNVIGLPLEIVKPMLDGI